MGLRPPNRYTAVVNPRYNASERERIGLAIIDFIKQRTRKGQGVGGQRFKNSQGQSRYAQGYIDTDEFRAAGKSTGRINLTLTGEMLDSLVVVDASTTGRVIVGFNDEEENDKSVFMREKGYDFLGLTTGELNSVIGSFGQPADTGASIDVDSSLVQSLIRNILGG